MTGCKDQEEFYFGNVARLALKLLTDFFLPVQQVKPKPFPEFLLYQVYVLFVEIVTYGLRDAYEGKCIATSDGKKRLGKELPFIDI